MARSIATNRTIGRDELLAFLRPRHHVILSTLRADGRAEVLDLPDAMEPLVEYFRCISGEHSDWDEYRAAMQKQGKCLIRCTIERWGPLATGGFPPELADA